MPLTAAASAREILTGLHDVMARRGSAQAKLDRVVDLIAEAMKSEVCSIYLLRGAARWNWQHSVAPTKALRYSITLRTASTRR